LVSASTDKQAPTEAKTTTEVTKKECPHSKAVPCSSDTTKACASQCPHAKKEVDCKVKGTDDCKTKHADGKCEHETKKE